VKSSLVRDLTVLSGFSETTVYETVLGLFSLLR
jgi:hypothetical protein